MQGINELQTLGLVLSKYVEAGVLGKVTHTYNLLTLATISSSFDSANYYCEHMYRASALPNRLDHLRHAMERRQIPGLVLEFGVGNGESLNHIASLTNETVYGFDSFQGLPEKWNLYCPAGTFAQQTHPSVRDNVKLEIGLFEETLPAFLASHPENISLLHVDCDLYSSSKTIFRLLGDKICPGTVIVFDEYINYVGWRQHEFKAFQEFVNWSSKTYRYESLVPTGEQVCVVVE